MANVNRVCNKLDEISILLNDKCPDIVAFTETWLDCTIPDSVIHMPSYSVIRRDRRDKIGGGVMIYVRDGIQFRKLDDLLGDHEFETLWALIRPKLLPREVCAVIVAVVYFPPWYCASLNSDLCNYIVASVDRLRQKYPTACFLITGDFNQVNTNLFNSQLRLKQLVNAPTRGCNVLDKIFSNRADFFCTPVILPPIARSDHSTVFLSSTDVFKPIAVSRCIPRRRLDSDTINRLGRALQQVRWQDMYGMNNCQDQADFFYSTVTNVFDCICPVFIVKIKNSDKPWINDHFRHCIKLRNDAWRKQDKVLYRKLRNKVNRLRISLRTQFYINKVERLKVAKPGEWWRTIKSLCGASVREQSETDHRIW